MGGMMCEGWVPGERVIIRAYYTMKSLALARARGHQFLFLCRRGGSWLHDVYVVLLKKRERKAEHRIF